ncbi:hypothetical protein Q7P37_006505 [Cladosporium fusiforme]
MAFQQPQQRPPVARQISISRPANETQAPASPSRKRTLDESQEWILFAPGHNADSASHTSQTPRTATHLSDLGSLETHIRSQPITSTAEEGEGTCQGTEAEDDGAELDSLDDGLRAFQHDPFSSSPYQLDQSGGTLLPTHDGLGTFTSSAGLQEQLWQFERYNPHRRRHVRRRSSLQKRIDEVEEEQELDHADEKMARIEKWRLEQSKAVVDEIERETRRRQRRMSRMSGITRASETETSAMPESMVAQPLPVEDSVIYEEPEMVKSEEQEPSESWWQRITRRVIQDLIGLDENTLSVIFGEELADGPTPTLTHPSPLAAAALAESRVTFRDHDHSWEAKLMERIAKELGVLVHQLSEHDGAFSSYKRVQQQSNDYAGLPATQHAAPKQPSLRQQRRKLSTRASDKSPSDFHFEPTMAQQPLSSEPDTSLWGIEEEPTPLSAAEVARQKQEREYRERDIDVSMIFSYLRRRFASPGPTTQQKQPSPPTTGPLPASWATSTDSQRRAEQIRRQHPLVSHATERAAAASQTKRRESMMRRRQMQKGSSSCASQSTKRSRRSRDAGSSRHYWDFGHSATGSVVTSGGGYGESGVGGWGEI